MILQSIIDETYILKLSKLGFQPSKQGREELPELILQSIIDETYILKLSKMGFQPMKQARETGAP